MAVDLFDRCFQVKDLSSDIYDNRYPILIGKMDFQAHTLIGFREGCREKTRCVVYGDTAAVYAAAHNLHAGDGPGLQEAVDLGEVERRVKRKGHYLWFGCCHETANFI